MKKQRSMGNKGFSLVELIIVIAIMAILVGVIGSQAIPYLEKARVSKDLATLDSIYSAFQSAIVENEVTTDIAEQDGIAALTTTNANVGASIKSLLGAGMDENAEVNKLFKSKKGIKPASAGVGVTETNVKFKYLSGVVTVSKGDLSISSDGTVTK